MELGERLTIRFSEDQWRRLVELERTTRRSKGGVVRLLLDCATATGMKEVQVDTRRLQHGEGA